MRQQSETKDVVKKRSKWDEAKKKSTQENAKGLNTIFVDVDEE